ncbi:F-box/WD repeat-containing protein 8 isoform X2 [Phascolarctos cinereus]|uniref:F-box/WD repeat-containing protein 8 n=1 Tax=Phascolarctos cinereus TaxID=38626 RepID=A0A6P5M507_PHACI|nr:F-box/WD repeat-containing protein 8 isoform X2 [Phascolarctos cinereus]
MAEAGLDEFRRRWREELALREGPAKRRRRSGEGPAGAAREPEPVSQWGSCGAVRAAPGGAPAQPPRAAQGYFELAKSLLEGGECPLAPPPPRTAGGPSCPSGGRVPQTPEAPQPEHPESAGGDRLLEQLIRDLNEINEIPFFDIQLPYELALKIFQYLGRTELGRCAQVSRTWKVLAEDEVLWYTLCQQEGYLPETSISDCSCWKLVFQESRAKEHTLRTNWKNRNGAVSQLQYELGKVLCDVHSCDGVVIAGYTSGDVRLWDTRTWDYTAPILEPMHGAAEPGSQPHVSFVRINNSLAVAAYEDGTVNVWSLMIGRDPVHCYQHNLRIQALALSLEGATIATASGFEVRMECPSEKGYWETAAHFEVQKMVSFLHLIPDAGGHPVAVAAAEDVVYLLKAENPSRVLHSVYGQPVTCLDVSSKEAAFGVKSLGWMNEGNKILLYSLQTSQCLTTLGSSLGDFTCVNLRNSPPHLLVAGNKDRRVRVYDLRNSMSMCSLYAHQLGVSAVQMDDWKIVSGGEEGLVCVWDQRMGNKLWEMHARHPVRHIWFDTHSLITANIPDEKSPRGASILDDDLTAHRRHRGIIYAYEFSMDQLAPESILPICRSSYDEVAGYNYNIGLAVPYDNI